MSLEQVASLAQIAGSVGVVLSLIFVGLQVRQNTAALYRNEHNSTMAQWTVIRMGIAQHRDLAEFMTTGISGERALDAPDRLRLEHFLGEQLWACFHIWDREQRGVFVKGTHEWSCGFYIQSLLRTPIGGDWWHRAKNAGFLPQFVAVVDALLARSVAMPDAAATASAAIASGHAGHRS